MQCPACHAAIDVNPETPRAERCPECGAWLSEPGPPIDSAGDSSDDVAQTFLSDDPESADSEFPSQDAGDSSRTMPTPDSLPIDSGSGQDSGVDGTVISDEWPELEKAPPERTYEMTPDEDAAGGGATFVIDEPEDEPELASPQRTIDASAEGSSDLSADEDAESPDATFILEDEPRQPDGFAATLSASADSRAIPEPEATYVSDDFVQEPDSYDKTIMSDDFAGPDAASSQTIMSDDLGNQNELKTLASNWSDVDEDSPRMTIKSQGNVSIDDSDVLGDTVSLVPHRTLQNLTDPSARKVQSPEYELVKVLGEGGMGIVWSARQTSVDRSVAVKMIKGKLSQKRSQRQKFLAEAVVTGDLDHPNIVPIYDVGSDSTGTLFYSMKQVQGTPWLKVVKEKSLHENVEILLRVADAIAFAHARGIVHRDLKPENVMLGEFGEVLVMDWGLALPTGNFEKARKLRQSTSMGGTPAYMAPEMATGPIDRITGASDTYLLGAILWEILTGRPPHPGKNVQECLLAAMRNQITPTEKTGELVDIALKAMATHPEDRHASVREFQQEIRDYLSHSESVLLAVRAGEDLEQARQSDNYSDYAKAVFGYEEAYELWNGNEEAKRGISTAKLAYAESALRKGDYDLGTSLLAADNPEHAGLLDQLRAAQQEREARQQRLKIAKRAMTGMAAGIFVIVSVAFLWIRSERNFALEQQAIAIEERDEADRQRTIAVEQKGIADEQRTIAQKERDEAERQEQIALEQKKIADDQKLIAQKERDEADKQRMLALEQKMVADTQRMLADEQRRIAVTKQQEAEEQRQLAVAAKEAEEYEAYIARVGLAAAKIDENAFDVALQLLEQCPEELRNWEWGRLMHLCRQASRVFPAEGPVDAVAVSPDGTKLVSGSWDNRARVWDLTEGKELFELKQDGLYVHAVAWSPDGTTIITAGSDPEGQIRFWDAETGRLVRSFNGHDDAVVSATLSQSGRWLLTTSYDQTARLWDLRASGERPEAAFIFTGHSWWVWDAAFSPDFDPDNREALNRIVTVSQDGKAIVWQPVPAGVNGRTSTVSLSADSPPRLAFQQAGVFTGHNGPVYSVDFSPLDGRVATAGYDKRVLLWSPAEVPDVSLDQLLNGEEIRVDALSLSGHTAPVQAVAFSADGQLVVSGSRDNSVKVWSAETGKAIKTFRGHYSGVRSVAITSDGTRILSGGQDQRAIVWNVDDYEEFRVLTGRTLSGHADAILGAVFSRDGQQLLTASRDRTARTWNPATGEPLQTFREGHDYLASRAVFFPGGKVLATAAADNTVRLWNVASGTQFLRLEQTGRTAVLALSHDSQWLVTGSDEFAVKLWRVSDLLPFMDEEERVGDTIEHPRPVLIEGHHGRVTAVAFSPVDNLLLSCDSNGRCLLHDVRGPDGATLLWNVRHHTRRVTACAFLPDGSQILTASNDHTVSRIATRSGDELPQLILKHATPVVALDVSADGAQALTVSVVEGDGDGSRDGSRVHLWDVRTAEQLAVLDVAGFQINDLRFTPAAATAVAVCTDNTVRLLKLDASGHGEVGEPWLDFQKLGGLVWSAQFTGDGESVLTVGGSEARLWDAATRREKISFSPHGAVAAADFSPDGRRIVTGSWDNSARIWDARTAQALLKLEQGHDGYINSVAFSPDGTTVLTASDDGTAKLWDAATAKILRTYRGHAGRVRQAVFSPDGTQVLTVSSDRTARLWNTETAEPIGQPFVGHRWSLLCAAFSPDGTRIVTGSEDNEARLWHAGSGELIAVLQGHTASVTSVAFSRDGKRILTASQDNTAKLWDATDKREGKEILTLTGHSQELTSVAFSPDGREVVTASRDGTAILWLTSDWTAPAMTHIGE